MFSVFSPNRALVFCGSQQYEMRSRDDIQIWIIFVVVELEVDIDI